MVQGELFQEDNNAWQSRGVPSFFSSVQWALSLDKIILLVIASLILFVLTYSFGFERGKRSMEEKIRALTAQIETLPPIAEAPQPVLAEKPVSQAAGFNQPQAEPLAKPAADLQTNSVSLTTEAAPSDTGATGAPALNLNDAKYTIQVVTALQKSLAEKEIEKLGKKGFQAFVVNRGKFFEVCVGAFQTVDGAKPVLSRFKTEGPYTDAFVRPIPQSKLI